MLARDPRENFKLLRRYICVTEKCYFPITLIHGITNAIYAEVYVITKVSALWPLTVAVKKKTKVPCHSSPVERHP